MVLSKEFWKRQKGTYFEKQMRDEEFRKHFIKEYERISIAEDIARLRHEAKLTQGQLAKKIKTSRTVITRYESGKYDRYSLTTLKKIAKACGKEVVVEFVDKKKQKPLQHA